MIHLVITGCAFQGRALAVSSGICITAGLAGVLILQNLDIKRRDVARVSVPEAIHIVKDQQVCRNQFQPVVLMGVLFQTCSKTMYACARLSWTRMLTGGKHPPARQAGQSEYRFI